jgi:hypothetical protein
MSNEMTLTSVARSEWIKFRSVRSTIMGMLTFIVLTIGLGVLFTWAVRGHWAAMSISDKLTFDPTSTSLGGTQLAQFAVGVIGSLFITSEYTSGAIRTTLTAVPDRVRLALAKLVVLVISMLVISEIVCVSAFLVGMKIFSGAVPTASLSSEPVLRAVLMAGVYLTLLAMLGFALGLIVRHSAATISVYTVLLLVVPIIGLFLPQSWQNAFQRYEPLSLGGSMMSVQPQSNSFGVWGAFAVLSLYVAVILAAGITMLQRRDA